MTSRAPPATRAILEQPLLGCVDARPHAAPYIVTTDPPVKGSAFETATRRWTGSSVGRVPVRVPQSAGDGHGGFDSGIGAAVVARFRKAGCEGRVSATLIGTDRSVSLGGDDSFVAASVFKVAVALAALVAGEEGRVDLSAPVTLLPGQRTPGPTGFSSFDHAVTASVVDLVAVMLSISDNAATDAVLGLVGLDAVNELVHEVGCRDTQIVSDLRSMIDGIGRDMGFRDWDELVAAQEGTLGEVARVQGTDLQRLRTVGALDPVRTTRTTADDMVRLLVSIWEDRAGPPVACARLRSMLGAQINRDRLARSFERPVAVAAKSGSMLGVVRNEVGVVRLSDGACVALAVLTTADTPYVGEGAINAAIADVAGLVVAELVEHPDSNREECR